MKKIVKSQKVKEVKRRPFHGEKSPYWDWNRERQLATDTHDSDGKLEVPEANPDVLADMETGPSTPQLLMGEAIEHLQGRQREVYLLVMRENKSLAEVAEILGIAKGAVDTYKRRAIKFILQYCKAAIRKGRV